ncbi:MAG: helix-turn-helix transcriptional regulator [Synechococcaceae cyanobacterium SM1_2_3]|nr:helix-turn-helix transcriptional regulator [Synechococcaceae cyanobacterium SM1_2_3]
MNVSDKIRFMRQLKGWSQEEMAEKLEMSPNGYANIERGETDVRFSRLEQIADVFGTNLTDLMSFGERNILYFFGDNNRHVLQTVNTSPETLMVELQKHQILLEQKDKEIQYLKEIIDLLKKTSAQEQAP